MVRTCREKRQKKNMEAIRHQKIGRPKLRWRDVIQKDTRDRKKKHKTEEFGELIQVCVLKEKLPTPNRERRRSLILVLCIVSMIRYDNALARDVL